ncbi:MAG: hypothetical protein QM638_01090 [Nocardioides sp.]
MTYAHAPLLSTPCLVCHSAGVFTSASGAGMVCALHAIAELGDVR